MWLRAVAAVLLAGAGWAAACAAPESEERERICTPGNNVFCRCADQSEGTRVCNDTGRGYLGECTCGAPRTETRSILDGGFERVDASRKDGGLTLDARCAGKLATVASNVDDNWLYTAAFKGEDWYVSRARGPSVRGLPRGVLVGNQLVAAWLAPYSLIYWTTFAAGQNTITLEDVSIGEAYTTVNPALVGGATSARVFYLADDNTHRSGTYSSSADAGWDKATTVIGNASSIAGKSAPAAALAKGRPVIVYSGNGGTVYSQTLDTSNSIWSPAAEIPKTAAGVGPEVGALDGSRDLLVAYVDKEQRLRTVARSATDGKWDEPILVDPLTGVEGSVGITGIGNGRAILVWKARGASVQFALWSSSSLSWSIPAAIGAASKLPARGTPSLSRGLCAGDAIVTWTDTEAGEVHLAVFESDIWRGPYTVPGMSNMTLAGTAEVP